MSNEGIVGLVLGILGTLGTFVVWHTNWIKGLIKHAISEYDKQLKDERLHELLEENKRLKEWAEKSKP